MHTSIGANVVKSLPFGAQTTFN